MKRKKPFIFTFDEAAVVPKTPIMLKKIPKGIIRVPIDRLVFGGGTGVSLREAKKAFLSGQSKEFRKKVKTKFFRR